VKILGEPDFGGPKTVLLNFYDWNGGASWQTTTMTWTTIILAAALLTRSSMPKTSPTRGNLWGGRIIPTLGARTDKVKIYTNNGRYADGTSIPSTTIFTNGFGNPYYTTVLQPVPTRSKGRTTTGGVVARPFSGLAMLEKATDRGNLLTNSGTIWASPTTNRTISPRRPPRRPISLKTFYPSHRARQRLWNPRHVVEKQAGVEPQLVQIHQRKPVSTAASTAIGRAQRIDTSSSFVWARQVVAVFATVRTG